MIGDRAGERIRWPWPWRIGVLLALVGLPIELVGDVQPRLMMLLWFSTSILLYWGSSDKQLRSVVQAHFQSNGVDALHVVPLVVLGALGFWTAATLLTGSRDLGHADRSRLRAELAEARSELGQSNAAGCQQISYDVLVDGGVVPLAGALPAARRPTSSHVWLLVGPQDAAIPSFETNPATEVDEHGCWHASFWKVCDDSGSHHIQLLEATSERLRQRMNEIRDQWQSTGETAFLDLLNDFERVEDYRPLWERDIRFDRGTCPALADGD